MKNKYYDNGDILLEGNNLYEVLGAKLILLIPWFVFSQILEGIKLFISSILLNFIFFGILKKKLKEIKKVVEKFYVIISKHIKNFLINYD